MSDRFSQPVSIFVGFGFPHDVETADDAFRVLNDGPAREAPAHAVAFRASLAAMRGEATADAAQITFKAFAQSRGILGPEAVLAAAERLADEWMPVAETIHRRDPR